MIRLYSPNDFEAIIELFRYNTPTYFAIEEEQDLIKYLGLFPESYFVYEEGNKILGAGGYNQREEEGHISWYFVHPEAHGKGIGKKLVNHSLHSLKAIPTINLFRVRTSQLAYKFFEKFGFQLMNVENDYWGKGLDLYDMNMPRS